MDPTPPEFDDRTRSLLAWRSQFTGLVTSEVAGVVTCLGGWHDLDGLKTLSLTIEPWKCSGVLAKSQLEARFTTTPEAWDVLWGTIRTLDVIRVRARIVEQSTFGGPQAEIVEYLGRDDVPELLQAAEDFRRPVFWDDRQFGRLTLDRRVNWFAAPIKWNCAVVELRACVDSDGSPEKALSIARVLWEAPKSWTGRVVKCAVEHILPILTEDWLDEDETPPTPKQFARRIKLRSITISPDGSIEFWLDDGNLFSGHLIQVDATLDAGPIRADIAG